MKKKKQDVKKKNYFNKFGVLCLAVMLMFTGFDTIATGITVKADTEQNSVKTITWSGYNFDAAHVDSVSYLQNINMHSGTSGFSLYDSAFSYGPLQNTQRYAYVKFDFTDENSDDGNIIEELKGATVNYAYLRLVEQENSNIPGTVIVKSPKQDWNPSTITYANQPELWENVWASCE